MLADRSARALSLTVLGLSTAGLLAELGGAFHALPPSAVALFSLSYEQNLPTWAASSLLLLAGVALAASAERARVDRAYWVALSAGFVFMSLDEAIEIHEYAGDFVSGRGVLYFSWVIPASLVVGVVGIAFFGFMRRLEAVDRQRFLLAGALFVGGAVGMELPLGWWTETHGDENLGYALIDWVEETLELVGVTGFLLALRARLARSGPA